MPLTRSSYWKLQYLLKCGIALARGGNVTGARKVVFAAFFLRKLWWKRDKKRAAYLARDVRNKGIWKDWRRAGLQHLSDIALIRFCGYPKKVVFDLANRLGAVFPKLLPHTPDRPNPIWFRQDKPVCDLLDITVLKLREVATVGFQHQLSTDMGLSGGTLWKYLKMGTYGLTKVLEEHPAAKVELLKSKVEVTACMHAFETSYGECPIKDVNFAYMFDGTAARLSAPLEPEERDKWWVGSKSFYGTNSGLLVSSMGLIHWYNVGLPGAVNDLRLGRMMFEALQKEEYNPFQAACIVDYGLHAVCTHSADSWAYVCRPFCPGKDTLPTGHTPAMQRWRHLLARFSAWLTSCRQSNEWINGDAKKGFPRWQMLKPARFAERMRTDLELFLRLYNLRVRLCDWSQTREVFRAAINEHFSEQNLTFDMETGEVLHPDGSRAEYGGDDYDVDPY